MTHRPSGVLRTASWRGHADPTHPSHTPLPPSRKGVPPDVLRQVKLLELRTRGLVNSLFSGEYRSVFKGQGMEFAGCESTSRETRFAPSTGTLPRACESRS